MNVGQPYARLARKEYSARARLTALAFESLVFLFGIPASLFWLSLSGDDRWRFQLSAVASAVSLVIAALGLLLGLWTVWAQFRYAQGTPVPVMATQKLLTTGPYALCRNPMALGALVFYAGIAVFSASFQSLVAVAVFALLLIAYIRFVEETELALRFGDEYSRFKRTTSFIIPRFLSRVGKPTV